MSNLPSLQEQPDLEFKIRKTYLGNKVQLISSVHAPPLEVVQPLPEYDSIFQERVSTPRFSSHGATSPVGAFKLANAKGNLRNASVQNLPKNRPNQDAFDGQERQFRGASATEISFEGEVANVFSYGDQRYKSVQPRAKRFSRVSIQKQNFLK